MRYRLPLPKQAEGPNPGLTRQRFWNPSFPGVAGQSPVPAIRIPCLEDCFPCASLAVFLPWYVHLHVYRGRLSRWLTHNVLARFLAPTTPIRLTLRGLNLASPSQVAKLVQNRGFPHANVSAYLVSTDCLPCSPERAGSLLPQIRGLVLALAILRTCLARFGLSATPNAPGSKLSKQKDGTPDRCWEEQEIGGAR